MSKVTPPAPAGADRLTVKVNAVVPALPSLTDTSLMLSVGKLGPQGASGDAVLRGAGAVTTKSVALLSVSVHPPAARIAAVVALRLGVTAASLQLVPLP